MAKVTKEEAYIIGSAQKRFRQEYQKKKKTARIRSKILWTIFLIAAMFIVFNTGFFVYEYHGEGMTSVASDGDIVITNRLSFLVNKPERGEIVTIRNGSSQRLGRIVGLPGDDISFDNGDIYINGARCIESYTDDYTESDIANVSVAEGTYYILNDDREVSGDSRTIDISADDIAGAEIAVIHVPSVVKSNSVYQNVLNFCKSGAQIAGNIESAVRGIANK